MMESYINLYLNEIKIILMRNSIIYQSDHGEYKFDLIFDFLIILCICSDLNVFLGF